MIMASTFSQQKVQMDYSADNYVKTASFVFSDEYTGPILSRLNAGPGDRILDLGCGSGELTVKIQNVVGAQSFVLGVDYNEDMVGHSVAFGHCYDEHVLHRYQKRRGMASRMPLSAIFRTLNYHLHCRRRGYSMQRLATLHCTGANVILPEFSRASKKFSSLEDDSFAKWVGL